MESEKIHWTIILERIEKSQKIDNIKAEFNNERILWKHAMILGKNGIEVPQELIDYDDDNIDYSDIPAITDQDISEGKINRTIFAELALEKEIEVWMKKENINVSEFAAKLIRNFYDGIKSMPKNAAL